MEDSLRIINNKDKNLSYPRLETSYVCYKRHYCL